MLGSRTDTRRGDFEQKVEQKARGVIRAMERARLQFLQKTRPPSNLPRVKRSTQFSSTAALTGSFFDYLPSELIIDIFSQTQWRDVVQLRKVSRAFKELIDVHEHVIVSNWLVPGSYLTLLSQLFYPPRSRTQDGTRKPTVQYFYGLERRHVTCSQLAYYLCDKAVTQMFRSGVPLDRKARKEVESKKEQAIRAVQRRLTKQLYYVLHFLTYSRLRLEVNKAAIAAENSDDYHAPSPVDLSSAYLAIQANIISTFDNKTLISTHHAMHFLVNSIRLSMSPEPPHNQNDEIVALMLRCQTSLKRCVEFFAADAPNASGRLKKQFMTDMQEERVEMETKFGGGKGLRRIGSGHSREGSKRIKAWMPRVGEVWFDAARKALAERGLKEHMPDGVYFFPDCSQELLIGCPDCRLRGPAKEG